MRIRLFTSRLHAAAEICAICHVSGIKITFSVVELILISCFLFKFLVDMHRKRVATERNCRRLRLELARIVRHRHFLRRRMLCQR